jgi:hypothetical protein
MGPALFVVQRWPRFRVRAHPSFVLSSVQAGTAIHASVMRFTCSVKGSLPCCGQLLLFF